MNRIACTRLLNIVALSLISTGLLSGCGGAEDSGPPINATVSGTVTSGGQPVTDATITFEKPGLGAWGGPLAADGSYSVDLSAGEFNVSVVPTPPQVSMNDSGTIPTAPTRDDIPEKYRTVATSETTVQVSEGGTTFDLDLKK